MNNPNFVHLHVRSDYSIIDSIAKIKQLIKKSVLFNMPALAITDFSNLFGIIKFYTYARKFGIKPIIGVDFLIQDDSEFSELTILASNNIGYRNLVYLTSKANKFSLPKIGPFIKRNWLKIYSEGLIIISGARKGDIGKNLLVNNILKVNKYLSFYKNYFPDCFYLELVRTNRINEEDYLYKVINLSQQKQIPVVATNDVRFVKKDDFYAHEVRVAIYKNYTLEKQRQISQYSSFQYLRSIEEMCKLFSDLPEALENSVAIAKRCNVNIKFGKHILPKFPIKEKSEEDYLIQCAQQGLKERLFTLFPNSNERKKKSIIYNNRLKKELEIINKIGFPSYFLIVMEFVQWSKNNNIPVGPGRGSGSASLVAYALKITDLDPIKFGLIFERFLNLERISTPDFDIDFCMEKRDLVISHVRKLYGKDSVSQIITFGTMAAKAVIRDVGRVLGYPYVFVDRIAKLIPNDYGMNLSKALITESNLLNLYKKDEEIKSIIDIALKLEGTVKNVGKHAGGIVITPSKTTNFAPLYYDPDNKNPIIQFDKSDVEKIGLIKFDFLGLRTLTVIKWTLDMINFNKKNDQIERIDISNLPLKDKKCFDLLKKSKTNAIFQLESIGMKELIKSLQPDCFEDIIALIALFRPGPLKSGMIENFINRKHGREKIAYPDIKWQHPSLKKILKSTYGIILYQEQVMEIAQTLANYSLGKADILCRAMAKKNSEEMSKQRFIFNNGAKKIGIDKNIANKIFNLVEKFAGYGFNKAHSVSYAFISYQTLWLKTYYPTEFMAAVMSSEMENTEKISQLIKECFKMNIKILPPNINKSNYKFNVNNNGEIVFGLGAIKGIGMNSIQDILKERNKNGKFLGLFNFCSRINLKKYNRRILENLIMSGSLDSLGENRASLILSLERITKIVNQNFANKIARQNDFFGIQPYLETIKSSNDSYLPWTKKMLLAKEKKMLGFYLTGHPLDQYIDQIKYFTKGVKLIDIHKFKYGSIITVAGLVISKKITTLNGDQEIGICTIEDQLDSIKIILFKDILRKYFSLFEINRILIIKGKVEFSKKNKLSRIIALKLFDIEKFSTN